MRNCKAAAVQPDTAQQILLVGPTSTKQAVMLKMLSMQAITATATHDRAQRRQLLAIVNI
jgi:hypothetical protein